MKKNKLFLFAIWLLPLLNLYSQNTLEFYVGFSIEALKNLEMAPVVKYKYKDFINKFEYQNVSFP